MTEIEHSQQTDQIDNELSTIPEKLRGKSQADLVQMYLEAESKSSRVANELGEARRMVTELLEVQPNKVETKKEPVRADVTADDLLSDPNKTLDERISTHPEVVKAREAAENAERELALRNFQSEHPSYQTDLKNPQFVEWVQKNEGRKRLIFMANQYDMVAASALWQMWGEHQELTGAASEKASKTKERELKEKQGTLEGASGQDASSEVILNRAELRELHRKVILGDKASQAKWNDPKFRAMRLAAYADGRAE